MGSPTGSRCSVYDVTGSTGTLSLSGIVVGAAAAARLGLLLAGSRRTSRRGRDARRGLKQFGYRSAPGRTTAITHQQSLNGQPTSEQLYLARDSGRTGEHP